MPFGRGEWVTQLGPKATIDTVFMDADFPFGGRVEGSLIRHRWRMDGSCQLGSAFDLIGPWVEPREKEVEETPPEPKGLMGRALEAIKRRIG